MKGPRHGGDAQRTREGRLFCNVDVVAKQGTDGGLTVRRYVDKAGNECAYYDSTLTYPLNAQSASPDSQGVIVLDMKDPAKPSRPLSSRRRRCCHRMNRSCSASVAGSSSR